MAEPLGEQNIRQRLTAFADGELTSFQIIEVLDYLSANPEALTWMKEEHRLRLEADRAVREQTPPVPPNLRARIAKMAVEMEAPKHRDWNTPRSPAGRWRLPLIAAGFLVAGIMITFAVLRPRAHVPAAGPAAIVPVALVNTITYTHVDCSRLAAVHTLEFPKQLTGLSAAVEKDLGSSEPHPDLSKLGYRYLGAGPCKKPLENTAHLLYATIGGDVRDTLSVFVQTYSGQFSMQPGKVYIVSAPDSPHPMLAWRTEGVVYFVVGDDAATVDHARDEILHRS